MPKHPPKPPDREGFALGRQLTIEYYGCRAHSLLSPEDVEAVMVAAARDSGATIISSNFHRFDPQGVSGVVIIAESHFTIHAWPEHDYAAVDIFTCGNNIDLERAIQSMADAFGAGRTEISSDLNRGVFTPADGPADGLADGPDHGLNLGLAQSERLPISWERGMDASAPWGLVSSIDIHQCDPAAIRDADRIRAFCAALCDRLGGTPTGGCRLEIFKGERAGIGASQFLDNAHISVHVAHKANTIYLDVFSGTFYDPRETAEFTLAFFRGDHYKLNVNMRQ